MKLSLHTLRYYSRKFGKGGTDEKHEESKLRQPSFRPRIERGTPEMRNVIYSTAKFDRDLLGLPRTDMVDISPIFCCS
jgi:hypothetical protein